MIVSFLLMNYSSCHQEFAEHYAYGRNKQDILDHPEKYLGPNYREVLNWWFYWDSLSDEQQEVFWERWEDLDYEPRSEAWDIARELASEVIGPECVISLDFNILELIAAHLYIERNIPFTIIPLIFDL